MTFDLAATTTRAQQIAGYWLGNAKANLLAATPYEHQVVVNASDTNITPTPMGEPGVYAPMDGKGGPGAEEDPKHINLPKTVGKVFFVGDDGQPHWCSGTSMSTDNRNVVATTGHCVLDVPGSAVTLNNWIFVPGYYKGKIPWGIYVGRAGYLPSAFAADLDYDYDYAFATVWSGVTITAENKLVTTSRLGDSVGGQGLAWNQKLKKVVDVFGYPAGGHPDGTPAYSGVSMQHAQGTNFRVMTGLNTDQTIAIASGFTGKGALGSSWLMGYKSERRLGYLNGISLSASDMDWNGKFDAAVSPYFDGTTVGTFWKARSADPTGPIL
ncbi:trypsin-like serine peptidase [Acrocarpospora corrugata]|nr:hypothetical protein [Acrocarpospora corrugata]